MRQLPKKRLSLELLFWYDVLTMLSWNLRRQLIILLGLAILVGGIGTGAYYTLRPGETCFDGIRGSGELGIDCGGVCTQVCTSEVSDLLVRWAKVIPVRTNQYDVAAFVSNPNDQFVVDELPYTFKVFDENNILIVERSGTTYVGPRDEYVIYEPKIDTGVKIPRRATIEFAIPAWRRISGSAQATVFVRNQNFTTNPAPLITAELVNSGTEVQRDLEIAAVLMEPDRNVFAVSRTVVDILKPQSSTEILFGWPEQLGSSPAFIELFPHYVREGLE